MKILTFDVEEWFHLLYSKKGDWSSYPSRLEYGIGKIIDQLAVSHIKATFFCVGWVAEKFPHIIKKIAEQGHDIGSHSYMHQPASEQHRTEFATDLRKSIDCLQQITGSKVTCFRAPGFSINANNLWVFNELVENGIETDSSIVTSSFHSYGGVPMLAHAKPYLININGVFIKEFPINSKKIMLAKVIYSGGGYFRLFPYQFIKAWTTKSDYVMAYFHYRDFDAGQPLLEGINIMRRFQSYYGIKTAYPKFQAYLKDFNFRSISQVSHELNWATVPVIQLSQTSKPVP